MKKLLIILILMLCSVSAVFAYTAEDVAGRWYMACDTPVGLKRGYIDCNFTSSNDFTGILNMFGNDNTYDDGYFQDKEFSFSGKIKFMIFRIKYSATGYFLSENRIKADIDSGSGAFKAIAARSDEEIDAWLTENPFDNW